MLLAKSLHYEEVSFSLCRLFETLTFYDMLILFTIQYEEFEG